MNPASAASNGGRGETSFEELKRYVGWGPADEFELHALVEEAARALPALLDRFYKTIEAHSEARRVFSDPEAQLPRQRKMLSNWVETLLQGPWDEAYAARRHAIGKAHVRHQMPQRYMLTAMNLIRGWFIDVCHDAHGSTERCKRAMLAVDRLLDIELAMMLDTYRDDLMLKMQRQERLATIGELGASVHHELKNPLAAIELSAQVLGERRSVRADPEARRLLQRVQVNVARSSRIISDLLSYARLQNPERRPTSVDQLVRTAASRVRLPARCDLLIDVDPELPRVSVDSAQLEQVLVNLLTNAADACEDGGHIRIVGRLAGSSVRVDVVDDGVGIDPALASRLFEPLFTTKPEGIGLGLSLSRHLVVANRGTLSLHGAPGKGTTASVVLPVS